MHHRPMGARRPLALRLALVLALNLTTAGPSLAQAASRYQLQIPAQSLTAALDALATQTGVRLLYSPEAVKGHSAPALEGSLDVDTALERLLQGTGLTL